MTYEQIQPVLHYWSWRLKPDFLDVDELFNDAYLTGRLQRLQDPSKLQICAKRAVIDALRKYGHPKRKRNKYLLRRHTKYFEPINKNGGGLNQLPAKDNPFNTVMARDLWDYIMSNGFFSGKHKLWLRMRAHGFTQKQVAKVLGLAPSRISQAEPELRRRLKAIIQRQ